MEIKTEQSNNSNNSFTKNMQGFAMAKICSSM